jgi:hypothetical protein
MLEPDFIGCCIEVAYSPLVADDKVDEEVFHSLRQLKVTGKTVAVATGDGCVPRVLFLMEKANLGEAGYLCVTKLQG